MHRLLQCTLLCPSDTAIRPSVRLCVPRRSCPRRAAALGYRHAGCLQLSHVRTADPSADGRRSAASRTAIAWGISSRRPRDDNLFKTDEQCHMVKLYYRKHREKYNMQKVNTVIGTARIICGTYASVEHPSICPSMAHSS